MIIYKSPAEIDLMREAGAILGEALAHLQSMARPGVTLVELDREADRFIRARDCIPGFVGRSIGSSAGGRPARIFSAMAPTWAYIVFTSGP